MAKLKINSTPEQVCEKAKFLEEFAKYTYSLKFGEEPNYNYLKFILTKQLLDKNIVPTK